MNNEEQIHPKSEGKISKTIKWILAHPKISLTLTAFLWILKDVVVPIAIDETRDWYNNRNTSTAVTPNLVAPEAAAQSIPSLPTTKTNQPGTPSLEIQALRDLRLHQHVDSNPILKNFPFEESKNLINETLNETIRTYCTKSIYLQITYDSLDKKIIDYLVISKSNSFSPLIPGLEKPLGKFRFKDYSKSFGPTVFLAFRANYQGFFQEVIEPDKSTNWVQVGLGYYHIGTNYNSSTFEWGPAFGDESIGEEKLAKRIRANLSPNAFLVASGPRFFPRSEEDASLSGRYPEWYTGASFSTFKCSDTPTYKEQ